MFYDKKIKYLDYYEKGERVKGCGFAKIEARDREIRIEITVSGLYPTDSFSREVALCGTRQEKTLTQLDLSRGSGELRRIYHNPGDIGGTGIPYWEICGLSVRLGGGREVSCRWSESENRSAERFWKEDGSLRQKEKGTGLRTAEQIVGEPSGKEEKTPGETVAETEQGAADKVRRTEQGAADKARRAEERPVKETRQPRMLEDKWQQLSAIYPHIQPFRDERDYLSIRPADFLLFSAKDYRQANNSFLLHGYYNYKHLLLSRVEQRGEILYYIGVPGNYFEKEKQVALMFGFESFECAQEPAQEGDFGYYMMRVQL